MKFKLSSFVARRYGQSYRRRRFISFTRLVAFFSVMIGSMALILSLSVLEGFEQSLRENAVKFTSHIHLVGFRNKSLPNYPAVLAKLTNEIPEIKSVAPTIEREGLVRSHGETEGVKLKGVDAQTEITLRPKKIIEGRFAFSNPRSQEVLIGKKLARKLNCSIGDTLIITTILTDESGQPNPLIRQFRLVGIYETGMAQYDDIYVYLPLETSRVFFQFPENSVSGFDIMLHSITNVNAVARHIEDLLGYPYFALTITDLNSSMFAWIELQKKPIPIVLGLISIVAVLNVLTMLLISVVEKTHSIGILRAIGMQRRDIMRVFIIQGIGVGAAGTFAGCGLGYVLCALQSWFGFIRLEGDVYFVDVLPIAFSVWHFVTVVGFSLLISFLATLIPAWIATRISPIKALRFG
ncbi:MAG: ABC transporter permease [Bacteroidetes bacterium]|nr:ABC transporter permease [Bacteroidota bacterium]